MYQCTSSRPCRMEVARPACILIAARHLAKLGCALPGTQGRTKLHCPETVRPMPCRLVERFLLDNYKPHQLSTYALTLYRHNFKTQDDKTMPIGAFPVPVSGFACAGSGSWAMWQQYGWSGIPRTLATEGTHRGVHPHARTHAPVLGHTSCAARLAEREQCPCLRPRRHMGHGRPGALQQHALVVLLPRARVHHGL